MKKYYLIFVLLMLAGVSNHSLAFTTYYYPTAPATVSSASTVCVGTAAPDLTCSVSASSVTSFFGFGSDVLVTYTWYYNTTGSVTVGTAIAGYTGLTYTCTGPQTLTLPSASISTATAGVYYYYVILTGFNSADGSYSPISITSNAQTVTVTSGAGSISGALSVCVGSTTTLTDAGGGTGTWSSSAGGTASVGASTGIVTGVAGGTATITFTQTSTGCYSTAIVTVNPLPGVITGSHTVCLGSTTTLSSSSGASGTWSSSAPGTVSIGATTGVALGAALGSATITYTMTGTGCQVTFNETVNPLPANIGGTSSICANDSTLLTDATGSGTWSGSGGFATINSSGMVSGASPGTETITYTIGTGCYTTRPETILAIPAPISGADMVCTGLTTTLTDITGGSTWSLSGSGATIGSTTGIVTGNLAGSLVAASDIITYTTTSTGCKVTMPFTVNPLPGPIVGIELICDSSSTNLFNASPGGTWSSSNTAICTIVPITGVTNAIHQGLDTITYTITATGCVATATLTVQPPPAPISGPQTVCPGQTSTLTDLILDGTWLSGSTAYATINPATGIINGISAGTSVITYVLGVCSTTEVITVNPLPSGITGISSLCTNGATTTLADITIGGTWSDSGSAIATINASSGVVTSVSPGTTIVTYQVTATNCYVTDVVTVNPLPAPIAGPDSVCMGYTVSLTDGSPGGSFSSTSPLIASVVGSTGVVTGNSPGTTQITYTLTGTTCKISTPFTVNPVLTVSTLINASAGDTLCSGNADTYTATSLNPGTLPVYYWTVNSAHVGGTGNTFTYNPVNGDIVKCLLTSNATCALPNTANSNQITMDVIPTVNPTVTMAPNSKDTVCIGASQHYTITSTAGGSAPVYLWTVNWIPVGTGSTSYTYTPNNGDIIRCGMISSSPCPIPDTAFAIDTMEVRGYDTPKVALVGLEGSSVCQGNILTLNANTINGGWGPTYYWSKNGLPLGISGPQYVYSPNDTDVISCTMISNYYCTLPSDTATATITVIADPIIKVTLTDSYRGLASIGASDTFTANVQNGGNDPSYQWYINGVVIPTANSYQLIDRNLHNKDSVGCIVTTGSGSACEGIKAFNWIIMEVAPTGVATIGSGISNIKLVPNPNTGVFTVEGKVTGVDNVTLEVTNIIGQQEYSETVPVTGGQIKHPIALDNGLANGVYMLYLITDSGSTVIRFSVNK